MAHLQKLGVGACALKSMCQVYSASEAHHLKLPRGHLADIRSYLMDAPLHCQGKKLWLQQYASPIFRQWQQP